MVGDGEWRMPSGKHVGLRIERIPVGYLRWMVNIGHEFAHLAEQELKRRGSVFPELEISGHAIDRASVLLYDRFQGTRGHNEGLHAWLVRMATRALERGEIHAEGETRREFAGMSFRFVLDGRWPVLKTVVPQTRGGRGSRRR